MLKNIYAFTSVGKALPLQPDFGFGVKVLLMTCRAQVKPVPPININRKSQRRQIINNNSIETFMPICIHAVV